jgi:hypothetical protein
VSRLHDYRFRNEDIWGEPEDNAAGELCVQVVQLIKDKVFILLSLYVSTDRNQNNPVYSSTTEGKWYWLEIPGVVKTNFRYLLKNTVVNVVGSERHKLTISTSKFYHSAAPCKEFNLMMEERSVFNDEDIGEFEKIVTSKRKSYWYALQFVSEGLGISLQVAWTPHFDQSKDLKIKALSRVNFVVSGAFKETSVDGEIEEGEED